MPPKQKKEKPKTDRSVKAIAKTKKGSAQAQTTKVVVNVGERKPARRRRPAKPKAGKGIPAPPILPTGGYSGEPFGVRTDVRYTQPPAYDGWYPPQNLLRNGSYIAPPPPPPPMLAPPPKAPQVFAPTHAPLALESGVESAFAPEPEMPELEPVVRQPYLIEDVQSVPTLAPPVAEEPTFEEIASGPPIKQKAPKVTQPKEIKEMKDNLVAEIKSFKDTLKLSLQEIFLDDYVKDKGLRDYTIPVLTSARMRLRSQMG